MTRVSTVFAIVCADAALAGVDIAGSEIVGLIPRKALEGSEDWLPTVENFNSGLILENPLGI
jgi:glutamate formiminotransferase